MITMSEQTSVQTNFFNELAIAMEQLGFISDVPLEVVIGGTQVYEIDGPGTKWSPKKGTRKYNPDAFIVIRKPTPVISSNA
jgi:hypothetical protein